MNKLVEWRTLSEKASNEPFPTCIVLMSSYNGGRYIAEQILSILNQKYVNVKLVIRDDGSKDRTVEIVNSLKNKYPGKIELIEGTNVGIHKSFAELVHIAPCGDYIAFSDQDDRWDNDKIAIGIDALKSNMSDSYSCSSRLVDQELKPLGSDTSDKKQFEYYMCTNSKLLTPGAQGCTMIITSNLFSFIRERDYPDYYGHDTWITIISFLLNNCIYDSIAHMDYRQHDASWTGNRNKRIKQLLVKSRYFIKGLERYEKLAVDILNRFEDVLSENDVMILKAVAYKKKTICGRIKDLHRYGIGKYGFAQNFLYKLYYVFSI